MLQQKYKFIVMCIHLNNLRKKTKYLKEKSQLNLLKIEQFENNDMHFENWTVKLDAVIAA